DGSEGCEAGFLENVPGFLVRADEPPRGREHAAAVLAYQHLEGLRVTAAESLDERGVADGIELETTWGAAVACSRSRRSSLMKPEQPPRRVPCRSEHGAGQRRSGRRTGGRRHPAAGTPARSGRPRMPYATPLRFQP